ncbi:hypothetical protein QJS10_CPB19g01760 [Acorus calamus]|uniref:Protein DCL, chloroplastic n=1 Tax=Acorus calamus TaxID=4465 RepID=A0AAV9CGT2_ACOCL|nr:hypothetical protein QJS10_CPB19g01760 [Acorus calamus]
MSCSSPPLLLRRNPLLSFPSLRTPIPPRLPLSLKSPRVRLSSRWTAAARDPDVDGTVTGPALKEVDGGGGDNEAVKDGGEWVDWENQILEDTVPLVGFVRMILHSGKYESGDRLSPEHEKMILERLLPYHPESQKKIGCGIEYLTIGYHPDFENSRCLFIKRTDGESIDFSYWKCIKGLIRTNYPLYADTFILRHFRRRRNNRQ